jgi:hypothetical protein
MPLLAEKRVRAQKILDFVNALPDGCATIFPPVTGETPIKLISNDSRWVVRVTPNMRRGPFLLYADQVTIGNIADKGCTLIELEVFGKLALAVNDRGGDIDLAYYQPGLWESWFGVDNQGDTVTHDILPYQDPNNPGAVKVPENVRLNEKPIHAATRSVKAPDDSKLFKRRRMESGIAHYGPTSKLRVGSGRVS